MRRRDILAAGAAFGLTGLARPLQAGTAPDPAAVEIGNWLLSHGVLPRDAARLGADLAALGPEPDWSAALRADFAALRVVSVDGWLISETEARLCALAALGVPFPGRARCV